MNQRQSENLARLLAPRQVAFIGGDEALFASRQCAESGFTGNIWGVNPRRKHFGDSPCFASVADLPAAPDAVFLAVPRQVVPDVVEQLDVIGAGGIVCYTAGFGELGGEGLALEQALVEASGDMALAGPNVFGMLNYVTGAHLWPFSHGGERVENGPAIISQSGMLSSYLLTNRRSLRFSYVIGAGNQSVLGVEDYLEGLADNPAVTGFGLYLETLRDVPGFANAVNRALARNVPVVVLKVGQSELASRTTVTHTGSLAGSDVLYQALFDRLGVARVSNPSLLLETLQMLTAAGGPAGPALAAFTCSGGDVAMLADCGEAQGIVFHQPDQKTEQALRQWLPEIATVSNPLDYTTPLWGQEQVLEKVFTTALDGKHDAALLVQDYPPPGLDADRPLYQADTRAFIHATQAAGVPAAVCSSLPENLDSETQGLLIAQGIAPLQGISEAVTAIAAAVPFGRARRTCQDGVPSFVPRLAAADETTLKTLDEWEGKRLLVKHDVPVPEGRIVSASTAAEKAADIGFPVALKLAGDQTLHKTEAGALRLNLNSKEEVTRAAAEILASASNYLGNPAKDCFLVEQMVTNSITELLVGVQNEPQFGLALTLASGGTLVEVLADSRTLLLPVDQQGIRGALLSLKLAPLLAGYRNRPAADIDALVDAISAIANLAQALGSRLGELDINPLMAMPRGCVAVDALIRLCPD